MTSVGRKLPSNYDDPIDSLFSDYSEKLNPYFKKMNFTPNGITTLSFIFGLLAIYAYIKSNYLLCSILYLIGYFFDCMDGNYARTYNMSSKFGDIYDHLTDVIVNLALLYLIVFNIKVSRKFKYIGISILVLFYIITLYYLACQEKYLSKINNSDILALVTPKCNNTEDLIILRYFGCGMFNICVAIFLLLHYFFLKK